MLMVPNIQSFSLLFIAFLSSNVKLGQKKKTPSRNNQDLVFLFNLKKKKSIIKKKAPDVSGALNMNADVQLTFLLARMSLVKSLHTYDSI